MLLPATNATRRKIIQNPHIETGKASLYIRSYLWPWKHHHNALIAAVSWVIIFGWFQSNTRKLLPILTQTPSPKTHGPRLVPPPTQRAWNLHLNASKRPTYAPTHLVYAVCFNSSSTLHSPAANLHPIPPAAEMGCGPPTEKLRELTCCAKSTSDHCIRGSESSVDLI